MTGVVIEGLDDPASVAAAVVENLARRRREGCDRLLLVTRWADVHPAIPGQRSQQVGAEGTPKIAQFAVEELGMLLELRLHGVRADLRTGRTQVASVDAAGQARRGLVTAVSADGMLLLVQSKADLTFEEGALAPRDPDVYARNRVSGELVRVTGVSPAGDNVRSWFGADDLSSDGRWVAFTTENALLAADQDSLVDVYLRNL